MKLYKINNLGMRDSSDEVISSISQGMVINFTISYAIAFKPYQVELKFN